jgi:hypothetical protein
MIFRRKKQSEAPEGTPVMRGRDSLEDDSNPLARRFHPIDEPDTIDLAQPAGFPTEPGTADLAAKNPDSQGLGIITLVPETGKIYAQPGKGDQMIHLEDEPVLAPTELRPGDRVRIGTLEMKISQVPVQK